MSRVFDHFNSACGAVCPVCCTNADWPTILIPIPGTEDDGICEARQVQFYTGIYTGQELAQCGIRNHRAA